MAAEVSEARRLGGREHRADVELLPVAAAASQTSEVDEHVGAVERWSILTCTATLPRRRCRGPCPRSSGAMAWSNRRVDAEQPRGGRTSWQAERSKARPP